MQNHDLAAGVVLVIDMDGRDPALTSRIMGGLWSHATALNLQLVRWEVGFFNLRDLQRAREPYHDERAYERRVEALYGVTIDVCSFQDSIALVALDGVNEKRIKMEKKAC